MAGPLAMKMTHLWQHQPSAWAFGLGVLSSSEAAMDTPLYQPDSSCQPPRAPSGPHRRLIRGRVCFTKVLGILHCLT